MRNIKELLQIMLDNQQLFDDGLCLWTKMLFLKSKITLDEQILLRKYINKNSPSPFSSLDAMIHAPLSAYYWKRDSIKPRIKWIEKHIKCNS